MNPHPYRLRPYHNPQNVDESRVPKGWRFRYSDEIHQEAWGCCTGWLKSKAGFNTNDLFWFGIAKTVTFIVPADY